MLKTTIYRIILITGLFPATIMLLLSFGGLNSLLSRNELAMDHYLLIMSIMAGIIGYIGIWTSLVVPDKKTLNLIFLIIGLTGYVSFISMEGGAKAWLWILKIEEPGEWLLVCWPLITAIIATANNIMKIKKNTSNSASSVSPDLSSEHNSF